MAWQLWPLTGILVLVPAAIALLVLWSQPERKAPTAALVVIAVSGGAVVFQIIKYGLPVAWWLAAGVAAIVGVSRAILRLREAASLAGKILRSLQTSLLAATSGIALVVGTQVTLAYRTDTAASEVKDWLAALVTVRTRLQEGVLLGPVTLAVLLVALIAVSTTLSPSLRVMRSYRRIASIASHCLLLLTVATSFTFFTAQRLESWEGAWIARRGEVVDADLADLDASRRDVVELAALEDALLNLPEPEQTALGAIAAAIEQYPDGNVRAFRESLEAIDLETEVERRARELLASAERDPSGLQPSPPPLRAQGTPAPGEPPAAVGYRVDAVPGTAPDSAQAAASAPPPADGRPPDRERMWETVTGDLAKGLPVAAVAERAVNAISTLERTPIDPSETDDVLTVERLRAFRAPPHEAPPTPVPHVTDLDVLGVARTRARAARQEAYDAVKEIVFRVVIPRSELTSALIDGLLARIEIKPGAFRGFLDRRRARQAMHAAGRPPPVWYPEIARALGAPAGASDAAPHVLLDHVAHRAIAARDEAARERAKEIERRAQSKASAVRAGKDWIRGVGQRPWKSDGLGPRGPEPSRPEEQRYHPEPGRSGERHPIRLHGR